MVCTKFSDIIIIAKNIGKSSIFFIVQGLSGRCIYTPPFYYIMRSDRKAYTLYFSTLLKFLYLSKRYYLVLVIRNIAANRPHYIFTMDNFAVQQYFDTPVPVGCRIYILAGKTRFQRKLLCYYYIGSLLFIYFY